MLHFGLSCVLTSRWASRSTLYAVLQFQTHLSEVTPRAKQSKIHKLEETANSGKKCMRSVAMLHSAEAQGIDIFGKPSSIIRCGFTVVCAVGGHRLAAAQHHGHPLIEDPRRVATHRELENVYICI